MALKQSSCGRVLLFALVLTAQPAPPPRSRRGSWAALACRGAKATPRVCSSTSSARPGLWQSVEAMTRRANIVLLPELARNRWLIDDLAIDPPVFTPNGDGINDQVAIRFAVLKVATPAPQVDIFDLSGHQVARLSPSSVGNLRSYLWNGVDRQGAVVPPGIYLCRIELGAQTGEDDAVRLIGLAY